MCAPFQRSSNALQLFKASLDIRKSLSSDFDMFACIDKCGLVLKDMGRLAEAKDQFLEASAIVGQLLAEDSSNHTYQNAASVSKERLADLSLLENQLPEAIDRLNEKLELEERFASLGNDTPAAIRNMLISHNKLGDLYLRSSDYTQAEHHYRKGLRLRTQLAMEDPEDRRAQRDLAVGHVAIGNLFILRNEPQIAIDHYEVYESITGKLLNSDPEDVNALRDHAVALMSKGQAQLALDQHELARTTFEKGREEFRFLASKSKSDMRAIKDLIVCEENIGRAYLELGQFESAVEHFQMGLRIVQSAIESGATEAVLQHERARLGDVMAFAALSKQAIGDWDQ